MMYPRMETPKHTRGVEFATLYKAPLGNHIDAIIHIHKLSLMTVASRCSLALSAFEIPLTRPESDAIGVQASVLWDNYEYQAAHLFRGRHACQ